MAIDQVSESVQRQERPIFSLKDFKKYNICGDLITKWYLHHSLYSLSLKDQDTLLDREFDKSLLIRGPSSKSSSSSSSDYLPQKPSSTLWPPLKSARYIKKQIQKRNYKPRVISTPSKMFMNESSINHNHVSNAIYNLSMDSMTLFDEGINTNLQVNIQPFWSKKTCQEFWNEYLECEMVTTKKLSLLSIKDDELTNNHRDPTCPKICYTKITKSIRKLLKRTFSGAPTFSELESLIINLNNTDESKNFLSCGQIINQSNNDIIIKLDTPFHRVWLHAICQYHGFHSQSKTVNDERLVHINLSRRKFYSSPKTNLYNFLLEI